MTTNTIDNKQLTLKEIIDVRRAYWLFLAIKNDEVQISSTRINNPKEYTINYCENVLISKNGSNKVTYKQKNNKGRFISINKSLQFLPRCARHTLCKNDYYDIDIVNSQPTILQQYFKKHFLKSEKLNLYIEYRNGILETLMENYDIKKDEAKMIFIKILNGGGFNTLYDDAFISGFHDEINKILHEILKLDENKILIDEAKEKAKENIIGSVISLRYNIIENEIIQHAKQFFSKHKYEVSALVFDGIMIRNTKTLSEELLNELNEYVLGKTGYKVKFIIKPMNEGFDIPEDELDNIEIPTKKELKEEAKEKEEKEKEKMIKLMNEMIDVEYQKIKNKIEKTFFILRNPLKICKYDEKDDELIFYSYLECKTLFRNEVIKIQNGDGVRSVQFLDMWLEDKERKEYDSIVFETNKIKHPNCFNLFTGFELENIEYDENVDCSPIFRVFEHVLKDKSTIEYVWDWIAFILQKKTKTEKCLFLISDLHGVGKSSIIILFRALMNKKYSSSIDKIDDLGESFNGQLENKLLVTGDEIEAKQKDAYTSLKNAITRTTIKINKKNVNQYEIDDNSNYIFSTNNYIPVKIEENDRRCVVIECNTTLLQKQDYTDFYKCIDNRDCLAKVFNFLLKRKIPDRLDMLNTAIKKDIQNQFRCSIHKYLFENMNILNGQFISTKQLLNDLLEYEKKKGYHEMKTPKLVAYQVRKITKKISNENILDENIFGPKDHKINKINVKCYDFTKLKYYLEIFDKQTFDIYNGEDMQIYDLTHI